MIPSIEQAHAIVDWALNPSTHASNLPPAYTDVLVQSVRQVLQEEGPYPSSKRLEQLSTAIKRLDPKAFDSLRSLLVWTDECDQRVYDTPAKTLVWQALVALKRKGERLRNHTSTFNQILLKHQMKADEFIILAREVEVELEPGQLCVTGEDELLALLPPTGSKSGPVKSHVNYFGQVEAGRDPDAWASVVNRLKVPLCQLRRKVNDKSLWDRILAKISYCNLAGLDPVEQLHALRTLSPDLVTALEVRADTITALPEIMPNLKSLVCKGCFNLNTLPSNLPQLAYLNCKSCTRLRALPSSLPSLKVLDCSDCSQLIEGPVEAPQLRSLECSYCPNLLNLPSELPELKRLFAAKCKSLRNLPSSLPKLDHLWCGECVSLQALPDDLPLLTRLCCNECTTLQYLPRSMPNLKHFECGDCPEIQVLPLELPLCDTLKAWNCPKLRDLPISMPKVTWLEVKSPELRALPKDLDSLYCLFVGGSRYIQAIPAKLTGLVRLSCTDMPELVSIPEELPKMWQFNCSNSPKLKVLPKILPKCTEFRYEGCPQFEENFPCELQPTARVSQRWGPSKSYAELMGKK
ncbi:MAG: hypothetical protein KDK78_07715 [Chlamydiia bacterium]|nr:hypothetical protein [Chlamydiia bacterium]